MQTTNKYATGGRRDTYQEVTGYVIEALEKGVAIWRKPWGHQSGGMGAFPKNLVTQQNYKGWNHFYLSWAIRIGGFSSPYFITFKQAQALGGHIRKGSRGYPITKWVKKDAEGDAPTGRSDERPPAGSIKMFPVTHMVFNAEQTEGVAYPSYQPEAFTPSRKITVCDGIINAMPDPPQIKEEGCRAFYNRALDMVEVPPIGDFGCPEEYYSTLFHELVHSTGHAKRLNRQELVNNDGFGGQNYSREELVAELGAAYLCGMAQIEQKTIDNSAAYIAGWLGALKNDKTLILKAASKAQAAADFILQKSIADVVGNAPAPVDLAA